MVVEWDLLEFYLEIQWNSRQSVIQRLSLENWFFSIHFSNQNIDVIMKRKGIEKYFADQQLTSLNLWLSLLVSRSDGENMSSFSGSSKTSMAMSPPGRTGPTSSSSSSVAYSPVWKEGDFRDPVVLSQGEVGYLKIFYEREIKYVTKWWSVSRLLSQACLMQPML